MDPVEVKAAPPPLANVLVEAWFHTWFHGLPGALLGTEMFNRCTAAKEDLVARLAAQPVKEM